METVTKHANDSEADFLLYTTHFCPYCDAAKRLLKEKGLTYQEFNFDIDDAADRFTIVSETGHRTVPIVIDIRGEVPHYVGGFNETLGYLN